MEENWSDKFLESQKQLFYEKLKEKKFIFLSDHLKILEEERKRWFDKLLNEESN